MPTVFTPGCKTNTQIQAFLQERHCFFVFYLRFSVTALAREAIAIVLFTWGIKTNTSIPAGTALLWCCLLWIQCSCMNARESPRPAKVVGSWSGPGRVPQSVGHLTSSQGSWV